MALDIQKIDSVEIDNARELNGIQKENFKSVSTIDATSIVLVKDKMTGTSFDLSKWTWTNDNPTYIIPTHTGSELRIETKQNFVGYSGILSSLLSVDPQDGYYMSFDYKRSSNTFAFTAGMRVPTQVPLSGIGNHSIRQHEFAPLGQTRMYVVNESNTTIINTLVSSGWDTGAYMTYKLTYDGTNAQFWTWTSGAWVLRHTYVSTNFITNNVNMMFNFRPGAESGLPTFHYLKNIYLSKQDFTTQYPS